MFYTEIQICFLYLCLLVHENFNYYFAYVQSNTTESRICTSINPNKLLMFTGNSLSGNRSKLIYCWSSYIYKWMVGIVVSNFNHNLTTGGCNKLWWLNFLFVCKFDHQIYYWLLKFINLLLKWLYCLHIFCKTKFVWEMYQSWRKFNVYSFTHDEYTKLNSHMTLLVLIDRIRWPWTLIIETNS